jgi:hypothetical protein
MNEPRLQGQDFTGSTDGLVGYWPFDGDHRNHGSAPDCDARGHLDEYSASLFPGSRALHFNGLGCLGVPRPGNEALAGGAPKGFSLELMLLPMSRLQQASIVSRLGREADAGRGFELCLDDAAVVFRAFAGGPELELRARLTREWHYVALSLRADETGVDAQLFVDGSLSTRRRTCGPFEYRAQDADHFIGGQRRRDFLYADLDFLRQWDRALGAEEIAAYSSQGVGYKDRLRRSLGAY